MTIQKHTNRYATRALAANLDGGKMSNVAAMQRWVRDAAPHLSHGLAARIGRAPIVSRPKAARHSYKGISPRFSPSSQHLGAWHHFDRLADNLRKATRHA